MQGITGDTGYQDFVGRMGPGNKLNQGSGLPWNFLNQYQQQMRSGVTDITGSGGQIINNLGSKVTTSGGGGGRALVNTAANATIIPGIGSIGDWTKNMTTRISKSPWTQAGKESVKELVAGTPGVVSKGAKGAGGLAKGLFGTVAPKATERAIKASKLAGMTAAGNILKTGGTVKAAQHAAKVAGIKAGGKIAGKYLINRVPFIGAGLDLAAGDPLGATGTLAGGAIGSLIAPGIGTVIGSTIGGPILKGGRQILSPIFGDPSDPLSGRDWSIGGMPITPYAKTKNQMEKQAKLYSEIQMPLMEQINNAQFEREMRMARLGMMQNMMSSTNSLMSQAYATSSY